MQRPPPSSRFACALLVGALALFAPRATRGEAPPSAAAPGAPSARDLARAASHFAKGSKLLDAGKVEEALVEFRASFDVAPSPNSLLMAARCLDELGRSAEAYHEFERAHAEAEARVAREPKYAATLESAREERDALLSRVGFLELAIEGASQETRVHVGGVEVPAARWPRLAVPAGAGAVEVVTPPHPAVRVDYDVAPGATRALRVQARPPAPSPPPPAPAAPIATPEPGDAPDAIARRRMRTVGLVSAGVGVAGFGALAVGGVLAQEAHAELEERCGGPCPAGQGHEDTLRRGKAMQTIANVGLAVGVVCLGAGVALLVAHREPTRAGRGARPAPTRLVAGPAWIRIDGAF